MPHSPIDETVAERVEATFERMRRHNSRAAAFAARFAGAGAIEVLANGSVVTLSDGRRLVDFGSYAVTLLGHRPAAVVDAIRRQLEELPTSSRILGNEVTPLFEERLCEALDAPRLQRVWLGCNGSDAVEASLKLARLASGRRRVVALEGAYHGKSMGALAVTHNERYRAGLADLLGGGTHVPAEIDALVAELERGDVAAFIFEPIQGEGGIAPVPLEFLRQAVAAARAYGVFVLADEIQVGLGRCGHVSLAGKWGLDPDAVLFGKVLGGGVMPLSAVVCSDDLYAPLKADAFVHTMAFAGHPLSCAAGTAGLELVRELLPRSADVDAAMRGIFVDLAERYPDVVAEARGMGAAWGIECCSTEAAGHVMAELTGHGLIHSPCLGRPQTLRLLPPLIATESDFRVAHEALAAGMAAARSAGTVSRLSRSMSTSVDSAGIWRLRVSA